MKFETETGTKTELKKPTIGAGKRLLNIVIAPNKTFQAIRNDPDIIIPGIIILLIMVATIVWQVPEMRDYLFDLYTKQGYPISQIASELHKEPMNIVIYTILMWLLPSVVLMIYNKMSMGKAKFKQIFSLAVYASIPMTIHQIITTLITKAIGFKAANEQINTSLALFFGDQTQSFLYRFLNNFELFTIWSLVLLVWGGAVVMKKSTKGLGAYIFVLWILLSAGIAVSFN